MFIYIKMNISILSMHLYMLMVRTHYIVIYCEESSADVGCYLNDIRTENRHSFKLSTNVQVAKYESYQCYATSYYSIPGHNR